MAYQDPMVRAMQTATPDEARAAWEALGQYLDNLDDDEDPHELRAAAESLQAKLDAAMESFAGETFREGEP